MIKVKFLKSTNAILLVFLLVFAINLNASPTEGEVKNVYNINNVVPKGENTIPDFNLFINGENVKFSDFANGKLVFLNFWGTWCGPCRREIPDIEKLSKDLKDKNVLVVGIALEGDPLTAFPNVSRFVEKNNVTYPILIGNDNIKKAFGGISAVPTTYIIGSDGKILETIVGMQSYEGFLSSINRHLK